MCWIWIEYLWIISYSVCINLVLGGEQCTISQEPGKNNNKYINNNTKTLCVKCLLGCEMDLCILDAYIYHMLEPIPSQKTHLHHTSNWTAEPQQLKHTSIYDATLFPTPTIENHQPTSLKPPANNERKREHNKIEPKFIGLYKNHVPYRLHLREN